MTGGRDDLDALLAKYPPKLPPIRICSVTRCGKRELIEAMLARNVSASRIAEIIRAEFNLAITDSNVQRHRRGDCTCPRP